MTYRNWINSDTGKHCLITLIRTYAVPDDEASDLLELAFLGGQIDQAQQNRGELKKMFGDGEDAAKELSEQKLSEPLGIEEFAKALKSGQEAKPYIDCPFAAGGEKG